MKKAVEVAQFQQKVVVGAGSGLLEDGALAALHLLAVGGGRRRSPQAVGGGQQFAAQEFGPGEFLPVAGQRAAEEVGRRQRVVSGQLLRRVEIFQGLFELIGEAHCSNASC